MFLEIFKMKLNKIMTFFCIGLPICVCLRIFQIVFTIELKTGFYVNQFATIGKVILAVIFGFCALLCWFAFKYYKAPENPPKQNVVLSAISIGLAGATFLQAFGESNYVLTFSWQVLLIRILGVVATAYFVAFGLKYYIDFKFPPILHIIPSLFMIVRTAFIFINTSSLAHISDNVLLLAAYCAVLVFFVNFAKLYNDIDNEKNFRKMLGSGLVSANLCLTQSLPHLVVNVASGNRYLHVSHISNISVLFMGIFVLTFLVSHFYICNKD